MRILVTDGMDKTAMAQLREQGHEVVEQFYEPDQLGAALRDFDVAVVRSKTKVRKEHIDAAKGGQLKMIIRGGVGVDNIDVKYAEENGITVKNTPRASSQSVAELAMGHMFACARYLSIAGHTMREGKWEKKAYGKGVELGGKTLGDALLAPTKIYVKPVLKVLEEVDVKGISHITGGGFYENIPRSLKKGCCARIKKEDVRTPALFHLMQKVGGISEHDMFNTFNMGVGMVLTVPAAQADKALEILHANGEPEAYKLGVIAEGDGVELC